MQADEFNDGYIGCCCPLHQLRAVGDQLSNQVVNKINDTLELVMVNDFTREVNENQFKRCLQDRISDISSWRWVLEDLSKRLEESKASLKYELKAVKAVVKRIKEEVDQHSTLATKPGALCPKTDCVEAAITEEYDFLKNQRKIFEELCAIVEKQINKLEKTINKIKDDILNKDETLAIEETVAGINMKNLSKVNIKTKQKKKASSLETWESKCLSLKQEGLKALNNALLTRQQVRGARVQLTIAAQALASKVDSAIRRRLHANQYKHQELEWQKQETSKDLKALEAEQMNTEQSLLANMEQQRVIEARLADRSYRPNGEMTKDEVDEKLRIELARIKRFVADLRCNLEEITCLQNYLKDTLLKIDCYLDDLAQVIALDEGRTQGRLGEGEPASESFVSASVTSSTSIQLDPDAAYRENLQTIKEEDENEDNVDDYPFNE